MSLNPLKLRLWTEKKCTKKCCPTDQSATLNADCQWTPCRQTTQRSAFIFTQMVRRTTPFRRHCHTCSCHQFVCITTMNSRRARFTNRSQWLSLMHASMAALGFPSLTSARFASSPSPTDSNMLPRSARPGSSLGRLLTSSWRRRYSSSLGQTIVY